MVHDLSKLVAHFIEHHPDTTLVDYYGRHVARKAVKGEAAAKPPKEAGGVECAACGNRTAPTQTAFLAHIRNDHAMGPDDYAKIGQIPDLINDLGETELSAQEATQYFSLPSSSVASSVKSSTNAQRSKKPASGERRHWYDGCLFECVTCGHRSPCDVGCKTHATKQHSKDSAGVRPVRETWIRCRTCRCKVMKTWLRLRGHARKHNMSLHEFKERLVDDGDERGPLIEADAQVNSSDILPKRHVDNSKENTANRGESSKKKVKRTSTQGSSKSKKKPMLSLNSTNCSEDDFVLFKCDNCDFKSQSKSAAASHCASNNKGI